jgi:LuxR family maltose regulon positive regulatory protein
LDQLGSAGRSPGRLLIQIQVITALLVKQNQPELARAALEKALTWGQAEGYVRTFIDQGDAIALLLRRVNQPGLSGYRAALLKAFSAANHMPGSLLKQANASLAEPLTSRELEILQHIARGAITPLSLLNTQFQ